MRSMLVHALLLGGVFGCGETEPNATWEPPDSGAMAGNGSPSAGATTAGATSASGGQGGKPGQEQPNAGAGMTLPIAGSPGTGGLSGASNAGGANANAGSAGNSSAGASSQCDPSLTTKNRTSVAAALDGLFIDKQASAIDQYWADPYLQHNPIAMSGVTTFKSIMVSLVGSASFSYQRLRTLADCDLVVVQGKYSGTGVIFDMFRVADGKLVEHWDSDANQASDSAGPTALVDAGKTAENRSQVLSYIQRVLVDGDQAAASELLAPGFVEHRAGKSSVSYSKVHHVIADGNFVFTLSEGKLEQKAYAFYDLFRVDAGAIVEHWDSRRVVPASTASGLPIF